MVDIFDEVEEELRAERARLLVKRYGSAVIAAALAVVVAVAGWQLWRWREARHDLAAAGDYLAETGRADALRSDDKAGRLAAANALATDSAGWPEGYATLALLRAAALRAGGGDEAGASPLWDRVARDPNADPLLKDAATLSAIQRQLGSGDPMSLEERLRPLVADGNPWRPLALEAQGLLEMRTGRSAKAKETFLQLSRDGAAPAEVRGRASGLLNRLGG